MSRAEQEAIIDKAIEDRKNLGIPLSIMTFAGYDFTDEGLGLFLRRGIDVHELYLMRSKVTDEGMKLLNHFENLEALGIEWSEITTDGLANLNPKLPLKELRLSGGALRPGGFEVEIHNAAGAEYQCRLRGPDAQLHPSFAASF